MTDVALLADELRLLRAISEAGGTMSLDSVPEHRQQLTALCKFRLIEVGATTLAVTHRGRMLLSRTESVRDGLSAYVVAEDLR